jgi:lipopolysaccharide biosynthesis glycosyltransferase
MKSNIEHINEVAFYRLFIPSIFKEYKKVIFLDCDICIDGDVAELYDVELNDNYVAAAKGMFAISKNDDAKILNEGFDAISYVYETLFVPIEDYFNAGVMIFNIKQILKDNKHLEFIDIYKNHKICHKRYLIERFKFFIFYQQPLHVLSSMLKIYTESRTQSNQENRLIR